MIQSLLKEKQKNDIIVSKTVTTQQRQSTTTANDICEENLVYLRIWSIGHDLPCNYTTNELQFQSQSIIAQSLSQDHFVTCIVSKIWTWERIQEEIESTLKQHLGWVPLTQPQNSLQMSTCFYHCSKDKSQPSSIPLPSLPKHVPNKTLEDNRRTTEPVGNCMKIEEDCSSSSSYKLYPIFHRMDFWNAIRPYESIGNNVKWAIDMAVFCQQLEQLGLKQHYDQSDLKIHDISRNRSIPMKLEESIGKRKQLDRIFPDENRIIASPNERDKGKKGRRRITCESTCTIETELQPRRNDKQSENESENCENHIESIKLRAKTMHETSRSRVNVQNVKEESHAIKCKNPSAELCSIGRGISQRDKRCSSLKSTVASSDARSSLVEDLPLTRVDATSLCSRENNSLDIGQLSGSISVKKKDGKQTMTLTIPHHELKEKGRHVTTASSNHNPKCGEKVKISTEMSKKVVSETSFFNPYDVICYPKRAALQNIGNRRLEILVEMAASHYDSAMDNAARSKVVNSVVHTIHEAGGEFFRWCQIRGYVVASPFLACLTVREKFDEALVFRGRPSQERSLYQILKVQNGATS